MNDASRTDETVLDEMSKVICGRKSPRHIRFNCQQAFGDIDLRSRALLEIGAGEGILSAYAAAHAARYVVALEPGAAGSNEDYTSTIRRMKQRLSASNLEIVEEIIQDYDSGGRKFDIVLLWNSVNHLDEPMCAELKRSSRARESYRSIMTHIANMMSPGALLILGDCSCRNVFPALRMRHPIIPQIEWEKHQSPGTWVRLLEPLGFVRRGFSWITAYPLRFFAPLLSNSVAAFLLFSHFRLVLSYDVENSR